MKIKQITYDRDSESLCLEGEGWSLDVQNVRSGIGPQREDSWARGKGAIPRSSEIEGTYEVCTASYYSEKSKSEFFPIKPDPIHKLGEPDKIRAEIGLHYDAPPKGTSGCIGVPADAWEIVAGALNDAAEEEQDSIPLIVT